MKSLLISLLLFSAFACTLQTSGQVQSIDIETVRTDVIGKDVQWVDVRTPEEYAAGHIDDAININVSDDATFTEQIEKLDREKPVYLYCQMGGRSKKASQRLKELGFAIIFDYPGGYGEWSAQP